MNDLAIPPGPARDALEAVREALDIPHAATMGDEETRAKILEHRIGHAVVMLESVLDGSHPQPDIPWAIAYLRARLAEHPATGYRTWAERVAELDAAKAQIRTAGSDFGAPGHPLATRSGTRS